MLSWPVPERLRLALFHAATSLPAVSPAVTVTRRARDALGRPGVPITISTPRYPGEASPNATRLMIDPATAELLAQPAFGGQGIVTAQGVVDSVRQLPAGLGAIRPASGPPSPPAAASPPRSAHRGPCSGSS